MARAETAEPDLSEFYKYDRPKKRPCQVGIVLKQMKAPERRVLEAACSAGDLTNSAILRWLSARDHVVTNPGLTSHRRQTCTCSDG